MWLGVKEHWTEMDKWGEGMCKNEDEKMVWTSYQDINM